MCLPDPYPGHIADPNDLKRCIPDPNAQKPTTLDKPERERGQKKKKKKRKKNRNKKPKRPKGITM